jgi:hypothetical protein
MTATLAQPTPIPVHDVVRQRVHDVMRSCVLEVVRQGSPAIRYFDSGDLVLLGAGGVVCSG